MFSLLHGVILPKHEPHEEVRVKWDSKRRDEFRSALIKLPTLYHVTDNIDISSIGSINSTVDTFTDYINSFATTFFAKSVKPNNAHVFSNRILKNAGWFYVDSKRRYFDAHRLFKQDNSRLNRHNLLACKIFYKQKYSFQFKKLDSIERLKHCKPKEFWKYFNPSKDKNANKISLDKWYAYFSNLENDIFFRILMLNLKHLVISMILIILMLIMMFMIWIHV